MVRFNRILLVLALLGLLNGVGPLGEQVGHAEHSSSGVTDAMPTEVAATHVVQFPVGGFLYSPADITIFTGSSVQWVGPFLDHPLVSEDSLWPTQDTGTTFSYTFTTPGAYRYYCLFHGGPGGVAMSGIVRVVDPGHRVMLPLTIR
jgi:plastocyanin